MATYQDLVNASLREIGVLAAGETPSGDDSKDAQNALNRLIDRWKTERLAIYEIAQTTWTIAANDGQYTVGTGGDVNVDRPVYVDHVNFRDTSQSPVKEYSLNKLTEDAWSRIGLKTLTSTFPSAYYYNPTYSSGLATVDLWPVPTSSNLTGVLYAPKPVVTVSNFSSTVSLPPGYEEFIVTNLAVRLAPSYGKQLDAALVVLAREAKSSIKRANKRLSDMSFDAGSLTGQRSLWYDIYRG